MKTFILAAVVAVLALLIGANSVFATVSGNNGTIKIHDGSGEPNPVTRNDPKVCTLHLHGFGFDANQEGRWWIIKNPPFKSSPVLTGEYLTNTDGVFVTMLISGLENGTYKLNWTGVSSSTLKHKVFKVACQPRPTPTASPSTSPSPSVSPRPTPTAVGSPPTIPSVRPNITPPATDTSDAVNFAATAVGIYLILSIIVGAIAFVVLLILIKGLRN